MISHWDDVRTWRGERGHIAGTWSSLTGRASQHRRREADPGRPGHVVDAAPPRGRRGGDLLRPRRLGRVRAVGGRGRSGRLRGARRRLPRPPRARERAHAPGGPDGLDVLAFGQRTYADGITWLPRAGVAWLGRDLGARRRRGGPPLDARGGRRPARGGRALAAAVAASSTSPTSRPSSATGRRSVAASATWVARPARCGRASARRGRARKLNAPPHCHSAEEEIFVVLEGDGHVLLWEKTARPSSRRGVAPRCRACRPVRAGRSSRPAGTGVAHAFRGGDDGMRSSCTGRAIRTTLLLPALGQGDLRGLGLVATAREQLDYWEGED